VDPGDRSLLNDYVIDQVAVVRQREQERTEQRNKELALMTNMTLAGLEIERRLRERLQSDGEIVVIKDNPSDRRSG